MKKLFFKKKINIGVLILVQILGSLAFANAQKTIIQYLSGTDKDHTVAWDFFCTKGRNSGRWATIPVPSNWEMHGFGNYAYYRDSSNPEQGLYRHTFKVSSVQKNKKIFLVFEASMTDTEVKLNGKSAGPVHQGGFYEFKYDVTDLIRFDTANLLEVTVSKRSANQSINNAERKADFWLYGGIFRPVYLEIVPSSYIERVAIDAKANGDFNITVFGGNAGSNQTINAEVQDLKGKRIGDAFLMKASGSSTLTHHFNGVKTWNPEQPNLYNAIISIKENAKTVHTITQRFGFRTTEMRLQDGFYVNGAKVIFKGVNRHSQWPETGRTLSRSIHLADIALIKGMNMNAVRMSHYPPDKEFLDLCDSLGLFVLDELTGWQAAYDTVVGRKLVKELVIRDVNHPSIVLWDNGNEGGWNRALDNDYQLYDPQKRWVIHPWERFNGTNTKHYPDFKYVQNEVVKGKEVFFPTEFMHGLFDGGHGAALDDFWNEMMKHPHAAGGFLWALHDEGTLRSDRHDSIDIAGNQAPDGIVGPHREKEGSYYTIKEIWSPVYVDTKQSPVSTGGKIMLENRYLYTNLNSCRFVWKLVAFPGATAAKNASRILMKGTAITGSIVPNKKGILDLKLPSVTDADALYLAAYDAKGNEIFTWTWALKEPEALVQHNAAPAIKKDISARADTNLLMVDCDGIRYHFDKATGYLQKVFNGKKNISFSGGPALAGSIQVLKELKHYKQGVAYIVEPVYSNDSLVVKWIFKQGMLPQLEYSYKNRDSFDVAGITFNFPEEKVNGMKWLGRGPYRVWKNRLKGMQFGVWEKKYNNTVTGESWKYPEFKGWHSELYWVTIQNKESDFTIYSDDKNTYLQMFKPQWPKAASNNYTNPPFAQGNIGFMSAISAIGTKFNNPLVMGPQSQKSAKTSDAPISGSLFFDFSNRK